MAKRGGAVKRQPRTRAATRSTEWEAGLATFAAASVDAFVLFDENLNVLGMNPAAAKLAELSGEPSGDPIGKNLLDHAPEVKESPRYHEYRKVIATGEPYHADVVAHHPKLGKMHLSVNAFKVGNGLGITVSDITERKRAEEALRESEEKYRNVVERANDGIVIIQDWIIKYINPRAAAGLGYTVDQVVGIPITDYVHPDELAKAVERYERRMAGEDVDPLSESVLVNKDGDRVHVETNAAVINYQGKPANMVILRNITERKRAEEALLESENKYRSLFDNAQDGIVLTDFETGDILDCNPEFERQTGRSLERLKKMKIWEIRPPEKVEDARIKFLEVKGKGAGGSAELEFRRPSGEIVPIEFKASVVRIGGTQYLQSVARDITERKRAEQALRENEAMLTSILRAAPTGIGVVARRVLLSTNEKVSQMTGYSAEELVGQSARMLYESDDEFERVGKVKYAQIAEEGTGTIETRWKRKDGAVIDVLLSSTAISGADTSDEVTFTALDITERKKAEEVLEASEERYRLLVENSHDAIMVVQDGVIKFFNARAMEVIGYSSEELASASVPDLIHPDDRQWVLERMLARLDGKEPPRTYSYRVVHKDGSARWVEINVAVIEWEGRPATLGFFSDITERRRAEEAVRESEAKYRAIFEQAGDSIFLVDPAAEALVEFNDRTYKNLGYTREEFQKLRIPDFEIIESAEEVAQHIGRIVGERADTFETKHRTKGGDIRDVLVSSKAVCLQGKDFILSICRDITDQKQAEDVLKDHSRRLEEVVGQRTRELLEAQAKLVAKERLATLGQLAGGVGHELRNPLGALKNAAYFLNMALENPEPEVKETLEILEKEVANSERIISSLFDFGRQKPPDWHKVDVNEAIQAALSRTAVPESIEVVSRLDETLPVILADSEQLGQVFGNIILNAVQAMPDGGRLAIKSEAPDPGSITVSIADTGTGMSPETLSRVYEPLFTTRAKGIGLGLALTKTIVEGHGGTIDAQSEQGKGSTFTVSLPASG